MWLTLNNNSILLTQPCAVKTGIIVPHPKMLELPRSFSFYLSQWRAEEQCFSVLIPPNSKEGILDVLERDPIIPVFKVSWFFPDYAVSGLPW